MSCELGLRFDDPAHVVVTLNEAGRLQTAKAQEFAAPLDAEVQRDLQWYFEVYPVQYTTEIDDERASRIADRIPAWGAALFDAVFKDREAERLFDRFQDGSEEGKLVTVSSDHPAVLAQPWELLRDPKGTFLFLDEPRISVRRQLAGAGGGRAPFDVTPKDRLHLLFVVSRPKDAGFIDPRADPQAVMDAIEAEAPGRVTWEFLRPATVEGLIRRLDDRRLPTVDILHFDGHGAYDWDGTLADRAKQAALAAGVSRLLRDAVGAQTQQGYLLFEKADGTGAPIAAGMLARALKVRRIAELGERLEALLATEKGNPLLASLNLSLERLDPQSALYLPRLGVFQGVAFEDDLIAISELDEAQWQPLRRSLEQTGLIQTESVSGIKPPFLRFHPTLAPALWAKLAAEEQAHLTARYQERYYQVSGFLYTQDSKAAVATVRAIARRELPNLLAAVYGALDAGAPWAIDFADNVNRFLGVFGLSRDRAALSKRAQAAAGEKGSENWYLARSNLGEQLLAAGRFREAEAVFADIVAHLGEAVSYKRCSSLLGLGRSYEIQGRASHAEAIHRQALAEAARLEPTAEVRRLISTFRADLGDVLRKGGQYANARAEYEASLAIKAELGGDDRGVAVVLGQMGALALDENKLDEAESRYRQALETFRRLGEPSSEAVAWHQLGLVYQRANRFQEAEHAYRESARICEGDDDRVAAAGSWGQLAQVMQLAGRPDDAEAWYVKAIKATQAEGDRANEALFLSNLAGLLSDGPGRLGDARSYAEEALVIKKTLDPAAAEIWKTYQILAEIAGKEGNLEAARGYRHEGRASYAVAPVGQETLRRDGDLIRAVVAAVVDPSQRPVLEEAIAGVPEGGRTRLVASLRRILDSERGEDALCEPLDGEDAVVVQAVLRGIADPESLKAIPSAGPAAENAQAADVALRLEKHLPLVRAVVAAINQPELRPQLDAILQQMEQHGWSNLVASIRRILNGEGSADALVGGLDEEDTLIISVILAALEKPDALHDLLDPSPSAQPGA